MASIPVYYAELTRVATIPGRSQGCRTAGDAVELFRAADHKREINHLAALFVTSSAEPVSVVFVEHEASHRAHLTAREVFRAGISANATHVFLLYRSAAPPEQIEAEAAFARRLELAGMVVGTSVLDYIMVTESGYTSLRERDLLLLPMQDDADLTDEQRDERMDRLLYPPYWRRANVPPRPIH